MVLKLIQVVRKRENTHRRVRQGEGPELEYVLRLDVQEGLEGMVN